MERLTEKRNYSVGIYARNKFGKKAWYDAYDLVECEKSDAVDDVLERLAEYEHAEEVGTLVRLPCKVGALVWVIKEYPFGEYKIEGAEIVGFIWPTIDSKPWAADRFGDAYSEVFHTEAEAKKRLKELQNDLKM